MSKKVLIFAPYALSLSHHEVAFEMVSKYRTEGWETHLVTCDRSFLTCDQNRNRNWLTCLNCKITSKKSFRLAGIEASRSHFYRLLKMPNEDEIPQFRDLRDLQKYTLDGAPVGLAVAASLIGAHTRDVNPDVVKFRQFITRAIQTYMGIYDYTFRLCEEIKPDLVYVFHGGTFVYSATLNAARKQRIECRVGERSKFDSYLIFKNTHCLDLQFLLEELEHYSSLMASDPEHVHVATTFFESMFKGKEDMHNNFPGRHEEGLLPANFSRDAFNIAVFTSSEDELVIHRDWDNPLFETQAEAIKLLADSVPPGRNIHLYVRIHPNLAGLNSTQERRLSSFSGTPNLTVISPTSPIQSYALLKACNNTLTFGSTIGIEAVYLGKPSILVGHSVYEKLEACYIPNSPKEFVELCFKELPPKPRERSYPYAYWCTKRRQPFRFLSPQDPKLRNPALAHGQDIVAVPHWLNRVNNLYTRLTQFIRASR